VGLRTPRQDFLRNVTRGLGTNCFWEYGNEALGSIKGGEFLPD